MLNSLKIILVIFPISMTAQTFPSIADKFIELNQQKIAYKDEGQGQILLCLHAVGHSSKGFSSLYRLASNTFRIISIDFPGHGKSDCTANTISATYFSELVLKFIDTLKLKDVIIIGNSIGGATAIRVASHNENIKLLSLSNPGGLDKRGWLAPLFLNYMVKFFRKGVNDRPTFQNKFKSYYKRVLVTEASVPRRNEIIADAYRLAPLLENAWSGFKSEKEDERPLIKSVHCPVLITWGVKDQFVRWSRNKNAIKQFKNHKIIHYKIGHTPYVECPDLFLKDFQEFINGKTILH